MELAVDILRQGADDPEVRGAIDRVTTAVADPIDRARKIAQELAPYCVRVIAGAVASDTASLLSLVGPVRVRVDAALQILKVAGVSSLADLRDEPSERFRGFLVAWFGDRDAPAPPDPPRALPPDPGEPARRRRDRNPPDASTDD